MYLAINKNNPNEVHSFHWTPDNKLIICDSEVNPNDWEILEMLVVPTIAPENKKQESK